MATYIVRTATTTNPVGHSFNANTPVGNDTYANSRFFLSFDVTAGGLGPFAGTSADGSITRTEVVPAGDPPTTAE